MRILVISNMYPPHSLGGYEQSCRDVVERFCERGHEVTVLTTTMRVPGVQDSTNERPSGILRDLEFYWRDHQLLNPPFRDRLRIERANQRALQAALTKVRPDVVSVWNMGAMSLGLLATISTRRIPLVLVVCDEWPLYGPRLDAWTRLFTNRPLLGRAMQIIGGVPTRLPDLSAATFCFISDFVRRRCADSFSPARISPVVYSGINEHEFPPTAPENRSWRWRLLVSGRIDERKGIHVAVRALTQLPPDTTLEINGSGDEAYAAHLRSLALECGVGERVRFESGTRASLRDRYAASDSVLFPVLWDEPFGLVPIEAMACGTPVIATGTGGSAEFLADEVNCLIVPPGDERALADAVRRLAGDPEIRRRLVRNGQETAGQLTIAKLAESLEAWHAATSNGFANGYPPERFPPLVETA